MKRLFKANSHISMSMIAVVPGKDYEIGKLYPKEVPVPVGSFFVPAITCNDFVFVAGQMASDESALDEASGCRRKCAAGAAPARSDQTEFVIKKLEPALKAAGSTWKDILKAQIRAPTAVDIPDALDVWQQHVGAHPCSPPCTTASASSTASSRSTFSPCATAPGARRRS